MNKNVFREKSLERIESPDQLNTYIKVANPSVWIILAAIIVMLIGFVIWGIFGDLSIYKPVLALDASEFIDEMYIESPFVILVPESDAESVGYNQEVEINGVTCHVTELPPDDEWFVIGSTDDEDIKNAHYLGHDLAEGQSLCLVPFGVDYQGEHFSETLRTRVKLSGRSPMSFLFD